MHDGHVRPNLPPGAQLMPVRELAAVTEEGEYSARDPEADDVERHTEVVESVFKQDAIIPAPIGTIFRSQEVLQRWVELHYVALSDALAWVEDRAAARVHISTVDGVSRKNAPADADVASVAAEIAKDLRRHAVAIVPLRTESMTGFMLSAAYLVERALWQEFTNAVQEEDARHHGVAVKVTGPWPPYDFVRMQFGS
jgi:Gas vesicle synthesis protein GvpL/GvpF